MVRPERAEDAIVCNDDWWQAHNAVLLESIVICWGRRSREATPTQNAAFILRNCTRGVMETI